MKLKQLPSDSLPREKLLKRGAHSLSDAELLAMPALVTTPAAEAGAVVRMNGLYLLGFGPRTADAALELAQSLYGPL